MTDTSPESRWLVESLAAARYVFVVVFSLFGSWVARRSYTPELRGGRTLSVVEDYSAGGGALFRLRRRRENGKLAQIVRNCNEYIG